MYTHAYKHEAIHTQLIVQISKDQNSQAMLLQKKIIWGVEF